MDIVLPVVLVLGFGLLAWWLWSRSVLSEPVVRILAIAAAVVLLADSVLEPSRRYSGLLFAFLGGVIAWRASYFAKRAAPQNMSRRDPS